MKSKKQNHYFFFLRPRMFQSLSRLKKLAYCLSIFTFISFILLILSLINRLITTATLGKLLPISGMVVLLGIITSCVLWILSSKEKKDEISSKWLITINKPLIAIALCIFSINLLIIEFGAIVILNFKRLFGAYLGLTPSLFLCISFTLIISFFLIQNSIPIKSYVQQLLNISAQELFLLILVLIGCLYLVKILSPLLIQKVIQRGKLLAENQLVLKSIDFIIFLLVANLLFIIFHFILKNNAYTRMFFNLGIKTHQVVHKNKNEQRILLSFLLSTSFIVAYLSFFPIAYDTNDDILIIQLLSGYIGGVPQEFPVYSNVILGLLFRYLFNINNQINWVVVFYLMIDYLSIWSLIYTIISARINLLSKFFGIMAILLFNIYFLSALTYTTIAAISSLAGLVVIISMILEKKTVFPLRYWTGLVLLIIGCLIRFEAACMVVLLFIPLAIFNLKHFVNRKAVIFLLLPALIISSSIGFNQKYLKSHPAWYDYAQYNKVHQQLRDTPRTQILDKSITLQQSVEWSQNDTYLFYYWFNLDQQVVSESKMRSLVTQISNWNSDISETLNALKSTLLNFPTLDFLYFSLACFIVFLLSSRKSKSLFCALLIIFILSFVFIILSWGYKLPPRVYIPMLFTFSILVLLLPAWNEKNCYSVIPNETSRIIFTSGIFMVVILLFFGRHLFSRPFEQKQEFTARHEYYDKILTEINSQYSKGIFTENSLVLAPDASFPFFSMNPYSIDFPKVDVLSGGWNSYSPAYKAQFGRHGFSLDPISYVNNTDLYLLSYSMMMSNVEQYYSEHYGVNIECDPVYVLGQSGPIDLSENPIVIYKINTKEN